MDYYIHGMHGMGDTIHERAIVRELLSRGRRVYLETSWPCIFHDLVGPKLMLIHKTSALRTQNKNAQREASKFSHLSQTSYSLPDTEHVTVWYRPEGVRSYGSVLAAMVTAAGCDPATADFRLPIAAAWHEKASSLIARWKPTKPLLIYRPLVERTEWSGCAARNPDHASYAELLRSIRDRYFVVSIADLSPGREWIAGEEIQPDVAYHSGELDVETIAALVKSASLVFTSPGFAVILAQAVGTPVVCVFGGYESGRSFSGGARFSRYLPIEPVSPCECFQHRHRCLKIIDMTRAKAQLKLFTADEGR